MRILVIDIGGTHVKVLATGHKNSVKIPDARENGLRGAHGHRSLEI